MFFRFKKITLRFSLIPLALTMDANAGRNYWQYFQGEQEWAVTGFAQRQITGAHAQNGLAPQIQQNQEEPHRHRIRGFVRGQGSTNVAARQRSRYSALDGTVVERVMGEFRERTSREIEQPAFARHAWEFIKLPAETATCSSVMNALRNAELKGISIDILKANVLQLHPQGIKGELPCSYVIILAKYSPADQAKLITLVKRLNPKNSEDYTSRIKYLDEKSHPDLWEECVTNFLQLKYTLVEKR